MTTTTLSYSNARHFNLPHINWRAFYSLVLMMSFLMLVFYVFSINKLTAGSYLISKYEKEASILGGEQKTLETNFAESDFLFEVNRKASELGFEKTSGVRYIQIMEDKLASAK